MTPGSQQRQSVKGNFRSQTRGFGDVGTLEGKGRIYFTCQTLYIHSRAREMLPNDARAVERRKDSIGCGGQRTARQLDGERASLQQPRSLKEGAL
jgi:hypothetical protein